MPAKQTRYPLLDLLRGLTLVSMVCYHAIWDLIHLAGMELPWFSGPAGDLWQQSICWSFILLSGFCWSLGRRHLRRGLVVLAAGALVSALTALVLPEQPVLFGILTLLGSGMLLLAALRPAVCRVPAPAGLIGCLALFALFYGVPSGVLGPGGGAAVRLSPALYRNLFTAFLGFPPESFYSSDYFPLLPWLFLYFAGYFLFRWLERSGALDRLAAAPGRPLRFLGRHSLGIYLAHQPALFLLVCAGLALAGQPLPL